MSLDKLSLIQIKFIDSFFLNSPLLLSRMVFGYRRKYGSSDLMVVGETQVLRCSGLCLDWSGSVCS